ncbi:tyrosine-type recombinase/integrase [Anaerocolumna sp.]|uniref:tyrosine-type recombinase/integrase n=1 Tax=Anaerocolumna sp. TaxID=2041569 RepID=UPI0028AC6EB1|nr:tyrosine-type recombinase/integrase [Anaerocolumna sp.]
MLNKEFDYIYNIDDEDEELIESLKIYSQTSSFDDMTWVLDKLKRKGLGKGKNSLYFANIPSIYIVITKKFVLSRLNRRIAVSTVQSNITGLSRFYTFLKEQCNSLSLDNVNKELINAYQDYLEYITDVKKSTKESYWTAITAFFSMMSDFDGIPIVKMGKVNPFSRTSSDRLIDKKYIPPEVITQFDNIFYYKEIPLVLKCVYWICRLIPSRIGEVVSIPIECIRQYGELYILTLNMYKQNGGYIESETRLIGFKNEDMGEYLLNLIQEQIKVAESLQQYVEMNEKDLLFTYVRSQYHTNGKYSGKYISSRIDTTTVFTLTDSCFRKQLNVLAERYQIRESNGSIYHITSHQLRHNAITDRIYEGFSLLEIKDLTHHKSTAMIEGSYIHPDKEKTIQQARKIANEEDETHEFRGKVINDNVKAYDKIMRMPRSHSLGRLGVCSDISACKSEMFECLSCDYFRPNIEELRYFEEQVSEWEEKIMLFKNNKYMLENAQYNLDLNKKIVSKIILMKETVSYE